MKTLRMCVIAAALVCPALALAEGTVDAAQLGHMQAVLKSCSRVDPRQASSYLLQIKALVGDATKEEVDQATRRDEYQQAYQAVTDELAGMDKEAMERACANYLASGK